MRIYYFNATHWDREWYQSFQEFRKYLLDMGDTMLTLLEEHPDYRHFTFDGQTVVLEDIVEIHPEWRPRLERQIAAGRLKVGPWYVMPDEFLVSGEAMIRNLQTGFRVSREFGHAAWQVGYVCDIFGHIAQLPRIMSGFGLVGIVGWRALYSPSGSHFVRWRAPGGSVELPTLLLSKNNGYGEFKLNCRNHLKTPLDEADFKRVFTDYMKHDYGHWGSTVVLSDGLDHDVPTADTLKYLKWIKELYPEAEVIHTDYLDLFKREFDASTPVIEGEQLRPADCGDNNAWQISGTLSSRYDIKRANDLCENELELVIEPQTAERAVSGDLKAAALLRYAWKQLLKNHAHDSICGCSVDQVHAAMKVRFDEIRALGRMLLEEYELRDMAAIFAPGTSVAAYYAADPDGCYRMRIHNPLPFTVTGARDYVLDFPVDPAFPKKQGEPFCYQSYNSFRIFDASGREVRYQLKRLEANLLKSCHRQTVTYFDRYTITMAPELAASAWTTLLVRPSDDFVRDFRSIASGSRRADNGILALEIHTDGTFDLADHRSGRCYCGLNDFEFDREIGDGWNHVSPVGGRRVVGTGSASVVLVQNGGECAEFEITRSYELPRKLVYAATVLEKFSAISESDDTVRVDLVTTVALDRGSDTLRWNCRFDNRLEDFRLKMLVPTGISGRYFAGQAFAMLDRAEGRGWGDESEKFPESEVIEKNFTGVVGKRDSDGGIAFLTPGGIHEAGTRTDAAHTLEITLARAFRRTVQRNGEESGGELRGRLEFSGAFRCFPPETGAFELWNDRQKLATDFIAYLAAGTAVPAELPAFVRLEGDAAYSSLKPLDEFQSNAALLRVFNVEAVRVKAAAVVGAPLRRAVKCRVDETEETELAIEAGRVDFTVEPGEIFSLKLEF